MSLKIVFQYVVAIVLLIISFLATWIYSSDLSFFISIGKFPIGLIGGVLFGVLAIIFASLTIPFIASGIETKLGREIPLWLKVVIALASLLAIYLGFVVLDISGFVGRLD